MLVTYASKDGRNLICVTMNTEDPNQYKDTIQLFNYGFDHFSVAKASDQDQTYSTQRLYLTALLVFLSKILLF